MRRSKMDKMLKELLGLVPEEAVVLEFGCADPGLIGPYMKKWQGYKEQSLYSVYQAADGTYKLGPPIVWTGRVPMNIPRNTHGSGSTKICSSWFCAV